MPEILISADMQTANRLLQMEPLK